MRFFIAAIALALIVSACKEEVKPKEGITFSNDFENVIGWSPDPTIMKKSAHSGSYCSVIDTAHPYSHTLDLKRYQISEKPIKKVKVSTWILLKGNSSDAKIVLNVANETNPTLYWNGFPVRDSIKEVNKWTQVSAEFDIANVKPDNPYNKFTSYVWNTGKEPVYVDDLEVTFID